uniref:Malonyl-CoA decarboxylase C-terminal domain-containing protein n=1 Tax=Oryza rufipogon TaxID=4529 RepID=A0A0E0QR07_ORYRU
MTRNHSPKSLAVLLRARMHPDPVSPAPPPPAPTAAAAPDPDPSAPPAAAAVRHWLHASVSSSASTALDRFSDGYRSLDRPGRREILRSLAADYDVPRARVRDLMRQYLSAAAAGGEEEEEEHPEAGGGGGSASAMYRMERGLREALRPKYAGFLEAMNAQPGGLKLLAVIRADLLALLGEENLPALRALDGYLKEKLVTWLSPAALTLHQITWDDPASLLEKIVAYEAVHPIRNLIDLKRRLGVGRRCFGYFHPAIPGEPLIFIEVALLKDTAASIQEVLWDDPPTPESEARCALFYSISSTQPGLSGINLGKFLLKRVIEMLRRDMPSVQIFATLSPIPGFMQWLLAKLASQIKLAEAESQDGSLLEGTSSTFRESILFPEEERMIHDAVEHAGGKSGIKLLQDILKSSQWVKSDKLSSALKSPLMRLCARYLAREKKRGKALDAVANFHLQNGAMIERINWMADQSEKGIQQSGGIMVNYMYRLENIEEYALSYLGTGLAHTSSNLLQYIEDLIQFLFAQGTLLDSSGLVPETNAEAIRVARSRGVQTIIATGKSRAAVIEVLGKVNLVGTCVVSKLSPGVFLQALLYSLEHRVALVAFSQDDCYTTFDDNPLVDFFLVYHEPKVRRHKFVFLETPEAISSMLRPHWARRVDGMAQVILIQAQSDVLEVVPLRTSKGNGVKIMLESLCASPDEVMALGDGENDKEMLQLADLLVLCSPMAAR